MRTLPLLFAAGPLAGGLLTPPDRAADPDPGAPTFARDIEPIVRRKCTPCHTRGGSAPFPLETYDQVRRRGGLIQRMVLTRSMPPLTGASDLGAFDDLGGHTTDEEGVLFQRWLAAGAPKGVNQAVLLPTPQAALPAWRLGRPDAILEPRSPVTVEVEGRPYWQAFVIPLGSLQGRRIRGFDVRVRQPLVARQATVGLARDGLVAAPRGVRGYRTGGSLGIDARTLLGAWAPGYLPWALPDGVAMTLNAEAMIVQMLYMPRGREEDGGFEVGLYLERDPSAREARWLTIADDAFAVPAPGALTIRPRATLPRDSHIVGVIPEGRFHCTFIGLSVLGLEAGRDHLFRSLRWEPYWAGAYRFAEPVAFPDGAELQATFQFDNDVHMGRNEGTRPRPILSGPRERDEVARIHVLTVQGWRSRSKAVSPATTALAQSSKPNQ